MKGKAQSGSTSFGMMEVSVSVGRLVDVVIREFVVHVLESRTLAIDGHHLDAGGDQVGQNVRHQRFVTAALNAYDVETVVGLLASAGVPAAEHSALLESCTALLLLAGEDGALDRKDRKYRELTSDVFGTGAHSDFDRHAEKVAFGSRPRFEST